MCSPFQSGSDSATSERLLPLCCHCDGRSGALEGAQGLSAIFEKWMPVTAMRAASDFVLAGIRSIGGAILAEGIAGPLKAETRVRIPLEPPPFRRGFPQHRQRRSSACCHGLLPLPVDPRGAPSRSAIRTSCSYNTQAGCALGLRSPAEFPGDSRTHAPICLANSGALQDEHASAGVPSRMRTEWRRLSGRSGRCRRSVRAIC